MKSIAAIIVISSLFNTAFCQKSKKDQVINTDSIQWISIEEAQELNKVSPKKIFIDVYTDWCSVCKKMDKKTFTNKKVIEYLNKHFYSVRFNAESRDSLVFNGNTFINTGRTHYFSKYLGATGYPTISFFTPDNSPIMKFTSYFSTVDLLLTLEYINKEVYRKQSYDDFLNGN